MHRSGDETQGSSVPQEDPKTSRKKFLKGTDITNDDIGKTFVLLDMGSDFEEWNETARHHSWITPNIHLVGVKSGSDPDIVNNSGKYNKIDQNSFGLIGYVGNAWTLSAIDAVILDMETRDRILMVEHADIKSVSISITDPDGESRTTHHWGIDLNFPELSTAENSVQVIVNRLRKILRDNIAQTFDIAPDNSRLVSIMFGTLSAEELKVLSPKRYAKSSHKYHLPYHKG